MKMASLATARQLRRNLLAAMDERLQVAVKGEATVGLDELDKLLAIQFRAAYRSLLAGALIIGLVCAVVVAVASIVPHPINRARFEVTTRRVVLHLKAGRWVTFVGLDTLVALPDVEGLGPPGTRYRNVVLDNVILKDRVTWTIAIDSVSNLITIQTRCAAPECERPHLELTGRPPHPSHQIVLPVTVAMPKTVQFWLSSGGAKVLIPALRIDSIETYLIGEGAIGEAVALGILDGEVQLSDTRSTQHLQKGEGLIIEAEVLSVEGVAVGAGRLQFTGYAQRGRLAIKNPAATYDLRPSYYEWFLAMNPLAPAWGVLAGVTTMLLAAARLYWLRAS